MSYNSRRERSYCEPGRPDCYPDYLPDRCESEIVWPERRSIEISNLPGIAGFWPMPIISPFMPFWSGLSLPRWKFEQSFDNIRRPAMYRYRYCDPPYRRSRDCCDRCGYYDCRCDRSRCYRCGYSDCRCDRDRCYRCGYSDCRCDYCWKCGKSECICDRYGFREYRIISLPPGGPFKNLGPAKIYIPIRANLTWTDFIGRTVNDQKLNQFSGVQISDGLSGDVGHIVVTIPSNTPADKYTAFLYDGEENPDKTPLAVLIFSVH